MTKHKPILTDAEVCALIDGNLPPVGVSLDRLEGFARNIERYIIKKLTEQCAPAAWLNEETGDVISSELKDDATEMLKGYDVPLYKCSDFSCKGKLDSSSHIADMHKMVTPLAKRKIQSKIDEGEYRYLKGATVLVNEHGRAAIVNYGGAFYWVENADMYVEFHRAETQFEPDHIPDIGQMVPDGFRLVNEDELIELSDSILGNYFRGQDWERERITNMLAAAPKYTGDK